MGTIYQSSHIESTFGVFGLRTPEGIITEKWEEIIKLFYLHKSEVRVVYCSVDNVLFECNESDLHLYHHADTANLKDLNRINYVFSTTVCIADLTMCN